MTLERIRFALVFFLLVFVWALARNYDLKPLVWMICNL